MDKFDWFKNEFENLSYNEQIDIFNRYCEESWYEDEIYPMDMFDEIFESKKPSEVFQMVQTNSGDVNYTNKFFIVTIYGFQTFNDPYEIIQYYISSLFDREHLWETKINIDDYIRATVLPIVCSTCYRHLFSNVVEVFFWMLPINERSLSIRTTHTL